MILREVDFLTYADLKGIESPEFAVYTIQRQSKAYFSEIHNLDQYRDRMPSPQIDASRGYSNLFKRLEAGEIWLVNNGSASDPAIAKVEEEIDKDTHVVTLKVQVSEKLSMRQQLYLNNVTRTMTPLMGVNNEKPKAPVEITSTPKPTKKKEDWIAVLLVDEYNEPIKDAKVKITDYSGKEHESTTNSEGQVKISDIIHGRCEIEVIDYEFRHGKPSYPAKS